MLIMSVAGIIFSNIHDKNIAELTSCRSMASVPFGCRYRLIDFTLSNMVNSGITDIRVIANYNYHSLMDHLGSGKDWDLARKSGGLKILPPLITAFSYGSDFHYSSRMEALKNVTNSLESIKEEYIVLSDCDIISNMNLNDVVDYHIRNAADITVVSKLIYLTPDKAQKNILFDTDENNCITDIFINPLNLTGYKKVCLNMWVLKANYLRTIVADAIAHNLSSFSKDVMLRNLGKIKMLTYNYEGYFACINSLKEYYDCSMQLLYKKSDRDSLFGIPSRPILTKVRNSPPTKYMNECEVSNSLIADGCVIEGKVENSILFRGVRVGKNTIVKDSILFQDTYVGEDVKLNCVITDKNALIRDDRILSGHNSFPFYIEKGAMI